MVCAEAKFKRSLGEYCSVCEEPGHQNNATYQETCDETCVIPHAAASCSIRGCRHRCFTHPREKFRHPLPGGPAIVSRDSFNKVVGSNVPRATGHCAVNLIWQGPILAGQVFKSRNEGLLRFKEVARADPSHAGGSQWEGEPLYPQLAAGAPSSSDDGGCAAAAAPSALPVDEAAEDEDAVVSTLSSEPRLCRTDPTLPHLSRFPPGAPPGVFLAHLDAAGAPRSYGKHWPYATGTKVDAALAEIDRIRASSGSGSRTGATAEKIVVFSDGKETLEVLFEACRRARGDGSVAMILGSTAFDARMRALDKFKQQSGCHVLLLAVGACASGLTLTHANHCILLELQAHEGKELQLINRVWRIGQTRPVTIKRFVAAGTIEERMLALRKRSRGLMAQDDVGAMTVSRVDDGAAEDKSKPPPVMERDDDLRYLYGPAGE